MPQSLFVLSMKSVSISIVGGDDGGEGDDDGVGGGVVVVGVVMLMVRVIKVSVEVMVVMM